MHILPRLLSTGIFLYLWVVTLPPTFALQAPIHHELTATLDLAESSARFHDVVMVPTNESTPQVLSFHLHINSRIDQVDVSGGDSEVTQTHSKNQGNLGGALLRIDISRPPGKVWPNPLKLTFVYSSPLPVSSDKTTETLLLSGVDHFYPQTTAQGTAKERITFQMTVKTPAEWRSVSQGEKISEDLKGKHREVIWSETNPQEEIFLVADRYHEFNERHGEISLHAYLREGDKALADRYIEAARAYIDFYSRLLGPYPYKKFAVVENSRQTGYGMPSFTLLGSRVIRFPFILHTSFPHEILHNWWGNGVYIDPDFGNWAEGLTTYLADHLLPELRGKGDRYRFQELMKFASYVNETNDFPLAEFKGRDSMASQAVGYGKTLMVLHMLRHEVGNETFLEALRDFYNQNRFRFAGFKELQDSFERVGKRNLEVFFDQWIKRAGAPQLELLPASYRKQDDEYLLQLKIRQAQPGPIFKMDIPIAIWLKEVEKPRLGNLTLMDKKQTFHLSLPGKPVNVVLDPYHEVFRRLNPGEVPPSIGQTYGSKMQTSVLPSEEEFSDVLMGYHQFAQSVEDTSGKKPLLRDNMLTPVPAGSVWVFGRNNTFAKQLKPQLDRYGVKVDEQGVTLNDKRYPWENHSFVFTLNRPDSKDGWATWLVTSSGASVPGLIRKLPHYGRYGYLIFKGDTPDNEVKGIWPLSRAGLIHTFEKSNYPLPPQKPLVDFKPPTRRTPKGS